MQDQRKYRKGNTCRRLPNGDNHYKDDEHKQHSSGILTDGNANTRLTHSHSHSHSHAYYLHATARAAVFVAPFVKQIHIHMYICGTKNSHIMSNVLYVLYGSGYVSARGFRPGSSTCLLNWRPSPE